MHTSRDVTFNEAELAGSKDVGDPSQGATAPATTANDASTTPANTEETDEANPHLTKDVEDGPVAGRTRKATTKDELPKKVLREAVGATEAPMKFVDVVVPPRDPNIPNLV